MTPREWLNSTNPLAMLEVIYPLRGMDSVEPQNRKSRLYLLACAREAWDRLPGVCRVVTRLAERVYGEPIIDKHLREQVYPHAEALFHCRGDVEDVNAIGRALVALGHATTAEVWVDHGFDPQVWSGFAHLAYAPFAQTTPNFLRIPRGLQSADLVREVFGNPLNRLPAFDPRWRSENVVRLAQHANTTTDFGMMPILADALDEAGCDRDDVLDHLRHAPRHCRGCWVLESILT